MNKQKKSSKKGKGRRIQRMIRTKERRNSSCIDSGKTQINKEKPF